MDKIKATVTENNKSATFEADPFYGVALEWARVHKPGDGNYYITVTIGVESHKFQCWTPFCAPAGVSRIPSPKERGAFDCTQDECEGCPFASIGGPSKREDPQRPTYISSEDYPQWLAGYSECAAQMYGDDWRSMKWGKVEVK